MKQSAGANDKNTAFKHGGQNVTSKIYVRSLITTLVNVKL